MTPNLRRSVVALAATAAASTLLVATPAQASGCVNSDEWYRVRYGYSMSTAESIMGTGGSVWQVESVKESGAWVTYVVKRYTECASFGSGSAYITYRSGRVWDKDLA